MSDSGHRSQRLALSPGEYTLGRSRQADLTLEGPGISRRHAVLRVDPSGRCVLLDLGSTNGTHLNGTRLAPEPTQLHDGDRIRLGRMLTLSIQIPAELLGDSDSASFDPITGAHDRTHLAQRIDRLVAQACLQQQPLSLAVVDIDRLQRLNTQHSATVGDAALRTLAGRLRAAVGARGVVARHEEDTFIAILLGSPESARLRLQGALRGMRVDDGTTCVLFTASVGMCSTRELQRCSATDLYLTALGRMQTQKTALQRARAASEANEDLP